MARWSDASVTPAPADVITSGPAGRHQRRGPARRVLVTGGVAVIAAAAVAASGLLVAPSAGPHASSVSDAVPGARSAAGRAGQAAIIRRAAAAWVVRHASPGAIVSSDPAMCLALQARGMPSGSLVVLGPGSSDPLGTNLVVATSAVRDQFGARLASVYAPMVVASFGSGGERIEVRAVAPDGSAAYWSALRSDLLDRRRAGAQLLHNRRITAGPLARRQLGGGLVDTRVLMLLAALAGSYPVRIAGFGAAGHGAASTLPLPEVTLAAPRQGPAAGYLRRIRAFVRAQRPPYLAIGARIVRLGGLQGLQITFSQPGPLGLLGSTAPGR
jgi:hypothetical protein